MNYKEMILNTVARFTTETLEYTDNCKDYIPVSELYEIFLSWCHRNHLRNCSRIQWTHAMRQSKELYYCQQRVKTSVIRVFQFAKLRSVAQEAEGNISSPNFLKITATRI
jgi:hypothetical protein